MATSLMWPASSVMASSFGMTNPVYDGRFSCIDARDHLVPKLRIEMDTVRLDERAGGWVVAFGLDALHFAEQTADAFMERLRIRS